MKKIISFLILSLFFINSNLFAKEVEEDFKTIIWNSEIGIKMLEKSQFKNDFYQLANFYQPQENPIFCAIATTTIILNAFDYGHITSQKEGEITKPISIGGKIEYPLYLQRSFFNEKSEVIKKRSVIEYSEPTKIDGKLTYDPGINLSDFAKILKNAHNLKVDLTYAKNNDKKSINKFRKTLKEVFVENKKFIVANFDGKLIGNKTNGHISPLVAYEEESDSILVLDTALHKNQWYWVLVDDFYNAMNSKDGNNYRGYLIVENSKSKRD